MGHLKNTEQLRVTTELSLSNILSEILLAYIYTMKARWNHDFIFDLV